MEYGVISRQIGKSSCSRLSKDERLFFRLWKMLCSKRRHRWPENFFPFGYDESAGIWRNPPAANVVIRRSAGWNGNGWNAGWNGRTVEIDADFLSRLYISDLIDGGSSFRPLFCHHFCPSSVYEHFNGIEHAAGNAKRHTLVAGDLHFRGLSIVPMNVNGKVADCLQTGNAAQSPSLRKSGK